jgi:hypothetical protein
VIEQQGVALLATVMAKLRYRADLDIPIGPIDILQLTECLGVANPTTQISRLHVSLLWTLLHIFS